MIIKCKVGPLDAPSQAPFSDVPANHWSAPYIAKGLELGIIKGYEDGSFKPNQTVSKAEALKAVLLSWNTLKASNHPALKTAVKMLNLQPGMPNILPLPSKTTYSPTPPTVSQKQKSEEQMPLY